MAELRRWAPDPSIPLELVELADRARHARHLGRPLSDAEYEATRSGVEVAVMSSAIAAVIDEVREQFAAAVESLAETDPIREGEDITAFTLRQVRAEHFKQAAERVRQHTL